jgi:hypothetical protein
MFELNTEFKKIDEFIEGFFTNSKSAEARSEPAKDIIAKLKEIRENCYKVFEEFLNIEIYNDDKENTETKNFVIILRDCLLDSLALRNIQAVTCWMRNYKDLLEIHSVLNLTDNIEMHMKNRLSEEKKRYASLYHCAKVQKKIKSYSKELKRLTLGLNSASCAVVQFVINAVVEESQLWVGCNNLISDISKMDKKDIKHREFNRIMNDVWDAYEIIQNSSLDKVYKNTKYEQKKHGDPEQYIEMILEKSKQQREEGERRLDEIKEHNSNSFDRQMRKVFNIVAENIEMRDMVNSFTKEICKTRS